MQNLFRSQYYESHINVANIDELLINALFPTSEENDNEEENIDFNIDPSISPHTSSSPPPPPPSSPPSSSSLPSSPPSSSSEKSIELLPSSLPPPLTPLLQIMDEVEDLEIDEMLKESDDLVANDMIETYNCTYCRKKFRRRDNMLLHERRCCTH